MQRYYLHMKYVNHVLEDPDGITHKTLNDALEEARQAIRDLAAEHFRSSRKLALRHPGV